MPSNTLSRGNLLISTGIGVSVTPAASVTGAGSTTSTYTIVGLNAGDLIDVYPQAAITAPLSFGAIWASAANTLSIQWVNASASTSSASPSAVNCILAVSRVENYSQSGFSGLPSSVT